ncbi:hypothetical protein EVAR_65543_1 [Eumeta japonica]|uniref:PiggyBac transposable element-derived protein domain-containing protein n=1 Tax=Eumeta variegata TaxID=151549 RepID=A0A4C1ZI33_EUMVA|nr:hypothetical protein EVAR_65543_1 [Eumeta japonica]
MRVTYVFARRRRDLTRRADAVSRSSIAHGYRSGASSDLTVSTKPGGGAVGSCAANTRGARSPAAAPPAGRPASHHVGRRSCLRVDVVRCLWGTAVPQGTLNMASRRNLKENEIERILLHSEDGEDLFLGEASEEEQDEVIQDFRDDVILSESPDALEVESPQDSDEEIDEVSSQLSSNTSPVTVLSVPDILRGRGRQKQKSSEKFVWHGSHPRSSRTPQRNIIFHPSGNKGIAKSVATGLDSWQLFFTNEVLEKIESHTNQEISEQRKKYKSDRPTISDDDDLVPSSTRPSFVRDTSITELKALLDYTT